MRTDNKTAFGLLIVNKLEEMNKNQAYLAQEVGLTQVSVYRFLTGQSVPTVKTLYSISKVTGISIEKLTEALLDES